MKWLVFYKFQEKCFLFEEFRFFRLYVLNRTLCDVTCHDMEKRVSRRPVGVIWLKRKLLTAIFLCKQAFFYPNGQNAGGNLGKNNSFLLISVKSTTGMGEELCTLA